MQNKQTNQLTNKRTACMMTTCSTWTAVLQYPAVSCSISNTRLHCCCLMRFFFSSSRTSSAIDPTLSELLCSALLERACVFTCASVYTQSVSMCVTKPIADSSVLLKALWRLSGSGVCLMTQTQLLVQPVFICSTFACVAVWVGCLIFE